MRALVYVYVNTNLKEVTAIKSDQSEIFSVCRRIKDSSKKSKSPSENRRGNVISRAAVA